MFCREPPPDRDDVRSLSTPGLPVKRVMRMMFGSPIGDGKKWENLVSSIKTSGDDDVDRAVARSKGRKSDDDQNQELRKRPRTFHYLPRIRCRQH